MSVNKKQLRRIQELAGLVEKSDFINDLYENYYDVEMEDELPDLEGPFKMKNGRVVYYDPKEGKYYDRRTDMYLSDKEAIDLVEGEEYVEENVILRATKGSLTENFKVGSLDQIPSMAVMLQDNGYEKFEITDKDVIRAPYAPEKQSVEEAKSAAQQAAIAISKKERGEEPKEEKKVEERELTKAEKEKLERLKKKYDDTEMKASMKKQYGDEWEDVYYGKLTKMAKEGLTESFEMTQEVYGLLRSVYGETVTKEEAIRELEDLFPNASDEAINELFEKFEKAKVKARQEVSDFSDSWRAFQEELAIMNNAMTELAQEFSNQYSQDYTDISMRRGEMGMSEDKDPCWDGYKQVGTKNKNGKEVPNCVKEEAEVKDTSKKFSKGDAVEYKGKKMFIVVPDGKADLVGIAPTPDGKVDMVKASEVHSVLNDKEKHDKKKEVKEADSKEEIKKEIEKLQKDKVMTAGHGRRARIQDKIDDLEAKLKKLDEAAVDATYYDNEAMPANAVDDMQQKAERTGQSERVGIEMKTPKDVIEAIDARLAEIKDSIDRYDRKGYNEKSVKANAVDALEQIKRNLSQNDQEGFMEAQVYFGTLMSPIWDLLPAKVVNYLAKGPYEEKD